MAEETETNLENAESASDAGNSDNINGKDGEEEPITRKSVIAHVKFLMKYAAKYWPWFSMAGVFVVISAAARSAIPYYTGKVISNIFHQDKKSSDAFYSTLLVICALILVTSVFAGLRGAFFNWAGALVNRQMRKDLFDSLIRQEVAFFDKQQTGAILSRLTTDCQTVTSIIESNMEMFMRDSAVMIGCLIVMLNVSWRLTVVTFVFIPPLAVFTKLYGDYCDKIIENVQTAMAEANQAAEECLSTVRTVRAFACENKESKRFDKQLVGIVGILKHKAIMSFGYITLSDSIEYLVLVLILFYAGHLANAGDLTIEQITAFILYQLQLIEIFYNIDYVFANMMGSVGASRKVFEYMNKLPEIPYDGTVERKVEGNIEFEDVSFAYPTRPHSEVLKSINISIKPGETVALVGPSGAGKSSIISLLEYFYETTKGAIKLDGVNIREYAHRFYHQQVSLVSQEPTLYSGSIKDNILYGCEEWCTEDDMIEAAKLANAHGFITELEKGYETKCGEKGVQMSGGQKQRIAIARALVRKPAVLILDEATSALDSESEYIIQKALNQCAVGRTVIVIAHRLSTVEKADRIFVIQKGEVVQEGNHQTLMQTDGLYRDLVKRQLFGGHTKDDGDVADVVGGSVTQENHTTETSAG
uniref:ABC transporter ATP-binding protein n=1 Tax=Bursaphelenchus xylophilus TaxID=6326 RepID=A0A1I7RMV3_BURXY